MSFLSKIFGGGGSGSTTVQPAQINYPGPAGFTSPGGSASFSGNNLNFTPSASTNANIGGLQSTFQNQATAFGNLAQTVQPGFSQFRRAGLNQINTQQQAATSNLRDTLAQRRVLGSSFANASLSQNQAEFAQQRADFVAQSYLQELQASNQLIQEQYQATAQSYAVGIQQSNLETDLAARLSQTGSQLSAQMAQAQAGINQQAAIFNAQQAAASQAGLGRLFGTIGSVAAAPFTGGLSLAAIPAFSGGGGGGSIANTSLFSGGQYTGPNFFSGQPTATAADFGGRGIGSGGFNFLDAQA